MAPWTSVARGLHVHFRESPPGEAEAVVGDDVEQHRRRAAQRRIEMRHARLEFPEAVGVGVDAPVQTDAGPQRRRQRCRNRPLDEVAEHASGEKAVTGSGEQTVGKKVHACCGQPGTPSCR